MQTNVYWQKQISRHLRIRRGGRDRKERDYKRAKETLLGRECVCYLDCGEDFIVYTYVRTYQIVHFKYVQFSACQLYLNKVTNFINKIRSRKQKSEGIEE